MDRLSTEKSCVSRNENPRPMRSIDASRKWFDRTNTTQAAPAPSAARASSLAISPSELRIRWYAAHAPRTLSVKLQMLKLWTNQV